MYVIFQISYHFHLVLYEILYYTSIFFFIYFFFKQSFVNKNLTKHPFINDILKITFLFHCYLSYFTKILFLS